MVECHYSLLARVVGKERSSTYLRSPPKVFVALPAWNIRCLQAPSLNMSRPRSGVFANGAREHAFESAGFARSGDTNGPRCVSRASRLPISSIVCTWHRNPRACRPPGCPDGSVNPAPRYYSRRRTEQRGPGRPETTPGAIQSLPRGRRHPLLTTSSPRRPLSLCESAHLYAAPQHVGPGSLYGAW